MSAKLESNTNVLFDREFFEAMAHLVLALFGAAFFNVAFFGGALFGGAFLTGLFFWVEASLEKVGKASFTCV